MIVWKCFSGVASIGTRTDRFYEGVFFISQADMLLPTPCLKKQELWTLTTGGALQFVFGNNKSKKKNLMQLVIEALSL